MVCTWQNRTCAPNLSMSLHGAGNTARPVLHRMRSISSGRTATLPSRMRMASYVPGELIPWAFVWLDPGITPC
jgi:hypothetical protein